MRLASPKDFWNLLKAHHPPLAVEPGALHAHYQALLSQLPSGYEEEVWLP